MSRAQVHSRKRPLTFFPAVQLHGLPRCLHFRTGGLSRKVLNLNLLICLSNLSLQQEGVIRLPDIISEINDHGDTAKDFKDIAEGQKNQPDTIKA